MYKVLIVDDEILDLEGMRSFIPWAELGLEVTGAVNNGFDALALLERQPVDILVTDVHMPSMTGLELARKAREFAGRLRVIFVSGYQDFHYVKEAIALNAFSYVLKPMDDKELTNALRTVVQQLDQEKRRQQNEQAYREIAKNDYLLKLLEGAEAEEAAGVLQESYGFDRLGWPVRAAAVELDDLSWKLDPMPEHRQQEWFNRFYDSLVPLLTEARIRHVCKTSRRRIFVLIEDGVDLQALSALADRIQELHPFSVTVGVGEEAVNLTGLRRSYGEALEALSCKLIAGKGRVIRHGELKWDDALEQPSQTAPPLEPLYTAVVNFDLVTISDEIDRLFAAAAGMRSKLKIQYFVMHILLGLEHHLRAINESLVNALQEETGGSPDVMLQLETIDDIRSWLRKRLFAAAEVIQRRKQKKSSKLVDEMIRYVKEQLHENVTLKEVADHLCFSPNYLGTLFKEVMGTNFSEYVIHLRMEKAGELLRDPRVKVYEVADRVGYRYMPYFSRQFKEVFGMTPGQFRRNV
ncbi:response regulator [Paenibacillus favisporus]|uniref:response regulator n=1 Tax=Paenibacillus favisporus TaxID=221028 RepID=UPI003D26A03E